MTSTPSPQLAAALEVLHRVFGYPAFRGPQAEVVEHVVAGGGRVSRHGWPVTRTIIIHSEQTFVVLDRMDVR